MSATRMLDNYDDPRCLGSECGDPDCTLLRDGDRPVTTWPAWDPAPTYTDMLDVWDDNLCHAAFGPRSDITDEQYDAYVDLLPWTLFS